MAQTLKAMIASGRRIEDSAPWPRSVVDKAAWTVAGEELAAGNWILIGLWAEEDIVHLAVSEVGEFGILSIETSRGFFPSIARRHPPAIRFERAIHDLFGLKAIGLPDQRPWFDHGRWGLSHPLAAKPRLATSQRYAFLPAEGDYLHQIPVGPVHAGIIEPGHFRFSASGEMVVRLEERLGYAHKGIESLMRGADLDRAAMLAGRTSGDSTVAYQLAFARATESALGADVPERAQWLRALMAELERLANHFGDIGAICNDASFALMNAHTGMLREGALRAADAAFGHRMMRDCIVPGGVATDLGEAGRAAIAAFIGEARRRFPPLVHLYDNTASLQDRTVSTGRLAPALAQQYGAGGYVGRASGRAFDARKAPGYEPYDRLNFEVPTRIEGDVDARVWIRIREVEQSLSLAEQILQRLPNGTLRQDLPSPATECEGAALIEGFRGDILIWLRLG